jgi:hypothetical protein
MPQPGPRPTILSINPPDAGPGQEMTVEVENIPSGAEVWVGGRNTGQIIP